MEAGQWRLLPPMRGRAFYPGGDGVWQEDCQRGLILPFPNNPLVFVGQDFDAEDRSGRYYEWIYRDNYHEEPRRGKGSNTWRNLLSWLDGAEIPWSACFFTNLFPGVRVDNINIGPSPALRDTAFVRACVDFLDTQIRIIRPCAAVIMGIEPIKKILCRWLPEVNPACYESWRAIAENNLACFTTARPTGRLKVGLVPHPALPNARLLKYDGSEGKDAISTILRECFSTRQTQHAVLLNEQMRRTIFVQLRRCKICGGEPTFFNRADDLARHNDYGLYCRKCGLAIETTFDVTFPVYLKDGAFKHKLSVVRSYQPHQIVGRWNLLNK